MIVPLYNAELAPPEIRGSLVALQQLAVRTSPCPPSWIAPHNAFSTDYLWYNDLILDHVRYA